MVRIIVYFGLIIDSRSVTIDNWTRSCDIMCQSEVTHGYVVHIRIGIPLLPF